MKKKFTRSLGIVMAVSIVSAAVTGCGNQATGGKSNTEASIDVLSGDASSEKENTGNDSAVDSASTDNGNEAEDNNKTSDLTTQKQHVAPEPRTSVTSTTPQDDLDLTQDIFVQKIDDLSDDFICGMDASSVLVEENSGVRYLDFDGNEADVFKTLSEAGVNYIRLRVWNDPYNENGYGYGGGNNDVETAIELGKRATEYGMKVCIDFHYSDFWADPKRQHVPKAWADMSVSEKSDALYEFTVDSLTQLLDEGVDVGMVQIGNEINYGMSGESSQSNVTKLLSSGSKAVREISEKYGQDISIVVHYTNIEDTDQIKNRVTNLGLAGVDYDIIGLSYYPFWDGDFENMQNVVKMIKEDFGKDVMIAETSYCYTSQDGDGSGNSVSGTDDIVDGYPATVQGQANILRDTMAAANEAGALGVFYWEGVWLPVGSVDDDNSEIWETYGSGWASSYAGDYDPDDAGLYYGGCSWDNQALFSFAGNPLPSLNVFKLIRTGKDAELRIDAVPDVYVNFTTGDEIKLPEKVSVIYNDTSRNTKVSVTWNQDEADKIDNTKEGEYTVTGTLEDGTELTCFVTISLPNVVVNPGFEDEDTSMWEVTYEGSSNPTDFQNKSDDAHSGDMAFHFWAGDGKAQFEIMQEITDIKAGTYSFECYAQGGDVDDTAEMELVIIVDGKSYNKFFMVTNWAEWKNPVITDIEVKDGSKVQLGVRFNVNKGSWGTVDDFVLKKTS